MLLIRTGASGSTLAEEIAENILCIAQGKSGSALAAAREIADRTEFKTRPVAPEDKIDKDLLAAARRITWVRNLTRALGCTPEELPSIPQDDLVDKLSQEVEARLEIG